MQSKVESRTDSELKVLFTADASDLEPIRKHVFEDLRPKVKAAGFRPGKAPDNIVEREAGPETIQSEVLQHAASNFYNQAVKEQQVSPLGQPKVDLKKFVPYSELQLEMTIEILPPIKLADYKKIKKAKPQVRVEDQAVNDVIEGLRTRAAKRTEATRPAKSGDEVVIDFEGTQAGKPVAGASAQDYQLLLGSGRFVKGFEEKLIGAKAGESKRFSVTFPAGYPETWLRNQPVEFSVSLKKVQQLELPAVNDEFAKTIGPFSDLKALREDITRQIRIEKEQIARSQLESAILKELIDNSQIPLPAQLVERNYEALRGDFDRSLATRKLTLENYLKERQQTEKDIEKELREEAEKRVKTALALTEVSKQEKLGVSPEELEIRMQLLRGRYQDKQMQEELNKPEARRDVANQLLAEKTLAKLIDYATA